MLSRCQLNGWALWVLGAVLLTPAVAYSEDAKPRLAVTATVDELIETLLPKYLGGEVDPADPVVQALKWRPRREIDLRVLGDPTQSYYLDPQFTRRPLPRPLFERDAWLTVPPEVMEDYYRRFVLEAKEPTYAVIRQELIFSLRYKPKFCADFVRFDLDLDKLSSVQLEILANWSRGGHNRIMLMGEEVGKYADFLGGTRAFVNHDINRDPRPLVLACHHETATDSAMVTVPFDWRENLLSRNFYWEGITATKTPDVDVVAYYLDAPNQRVYTEDEEDEETPEDQLVAAFGRFRCGQTDVYFRPYYMAEGPDGDRFELNWMMWIMYVELSAPASPIVPPSPEPVNPGAQGLPGEEPTKDKLYRQPSSTEFKEPFDYETLKPATEMPDHAPKGRDDQPTPAEPSDYRPEGISYEGMEDRPDFSEWVTAVDAAMTDETDEFNEAEGAVVTEDAVTQVEYDGVVGTDQGIDAVVPVEDPEESNESPESFQDEVEDDDTLELEAYEEPTKPFERENVPHSPMNIVPNRERSLQRDRPLARDRAGRRDRSLVRER